MLCVKYVGGKRRGSAEGLLSKGLTAVRLLGFAG